MKSDEIDLLIIIEKGIEQEEARNKQEGSLLTIEDPIDKNYSPILQTEAETETLIVSNTKMKNKIQIPFGFFFSYTTKQN